MFAEAIETSSRFTRAIHTITRTYGDTRIIPGAATLFFVNEEGYAITCKHVAELLINADRINKHYAAFKTEQASLTNDELYQLKLAELETKYNYNRSSIIQVKNNFLHCVDNMSGFTAHLHPVHDLAIIKFNDFGKIAYEGYALLVKDATRIRQGDFLCRLGFPFPEFNNFRYNEASDDIEWTPSGIAASPRFPIEGMVTRFLKNEQGVFGIELSTPGLRGQSGGPLFNQDGIVYGMQFSTKHLHLGFDIINKEIISLNEPTTVSDYSFLHLGQCIHVDVIKAFLQQMNVKYYEA